MISFVLINKISKMSFKIIIIYLKIYFKTKSVLKVQA